MFGRYVPCLLLCLLAQFGAGLSAQELPLPKRPADAPKGSEFARSIAALPLAEREKEIRAQVAAGNVPDFWRRVAPVKVTRVADGRAWTAVYFVTPDYLAIGSDDDYFLAPVSPATAQKIADSLGCVLPTRKMVDDIFGAAAVQLTPSPIPPSPAMTTVPVFQRHSEGVLLQRAEHLEKHPPGALVAGHKKDIVITPRLATAPGKVAIYGWHQADGKAIQPLYLGHTEAWVDYSHGVRFVRRNLFLNGEPHTIEEVLGDAKLSGLLSDEGPVTSARYDSALAPPPIPVETVATSGALAGFVESPHFKEQVLTFSLELGVRVHINAPARSLFDSNKPVRLVLYALPNGNTIEQTVGRRIKPGDDWHFDIQHIGAQTRWLRDTTHDANLVVAYLECSEKAWPVWRRKNDLDGRRIVRIVDALRGRFAPRTVKLVLSGHSGGGSFIFGFLNGVERIPDDVERITFLDSNYGYDTAQNHGEKLARWLGAPGEHCLSVLAYNDSVALLNGKKFVSETGGTWARSRLMLQDLAAKFEFTRENDAEFQRATALGRRVKFLLKENPTQSVLHTTQVERNGFIQSLLSGTADEGKGYAYFGPRAYEKWLQPD